MKKLILSFLASIFFFNTYPQGKMELIPYRKGEKFGFCTQDKKIVIKPKYDEVSFFKGKLASVKIDDSWGVINDKGNIIVPTNYTTIEICGEMILANNRDNYSIFDKSGKEMPTVSKKYNWFSAADESGLIIVTESYKYGLINDKGNALVPAKYDFISNFNSGMARFKKDGKWGFINKAGKEVIPAEYDDAENFQEDLAIVMKNGKRGVINKQNKLLFPLSSGTVSINDNIAKVLEPSGCKFYDKNGNLILKLDGSFNWVSDFYDGVAAVETEDSKYFISKDGKKLFEHSFREYDKFQEGLLLVKQAGFYGFVDKSGNFVIEPEFDLAYSFSEGLAKATIDDKFGFIDKKGKMVIDISELKEYPISDFKNGYATVFGGKEGPFIYGVISRNGTKYWED